MTYQWHRGELWNNEWIYHNDHRGSIRTLKRIRCKVEGENSWLLRVDVSRRPSSGDWRNVGGACGQLHTLRILAERSNLLERGIRVI